MLLAARTTQAAGLARRPAACAVPVVRRAPSRRAIAAAAMPVTGELASLAAAVERALGPTAESLAALNLPEPLIHWGHPGNMAVVLLAMLGYGGVYLGYQIRNEAGGDAAALEAARDMHPKLAIGATFFFFLGASGGVMSLLMQHKPVLESPHFISGMLGLSLLSIQAMLPLFFSEGQSVRTAHAYLGTSIFALLVVHGALGLKLGLSI